MEQASSSVAGRAEIKPRDPGISFDEVPRHWLNGHRVATQLANGVSILFPMGERFFVRSVRHYEKAIAGDPGLLAQVKGFYGQEGRHAGMHEKHFEVLRAQGFEIDRFLAVYRRVAFEMIEPLASPALRLSVTAALEHYTALMADNALRDGFLATADPAMKALLLWHAAEEIEHRAVAFDVLQHVQPSYPLRVAGMAVATGLLVGFWTAASLVLLRQDGALGPETFRQWRETQQRNPIGKRVFLRGIREYLARGFHPLQNDLDARAHEYLAGVGLA
jgi:hypothetical protein